MHLDVEQLHYSQLDSGQWTAQEMQASECGACPKVKRQLTQEHLSLATRSALRTLLARLPVLMESLLPLEGKLGACTTWTFSENWRAQIQQRQILICQRKSSGTGDTAIWVLKT